MNKYHFRILVGISLVMIIPMTVAILIAEKQLPVELATYVKNDFEKDMSVIEIAIGLFGLIAIAANIGLLFFANWARHLFAVFVILSSLCTLFLGASVQTAFENTISEFIMIIDGMIIGIIYFSDIKNEFNP